MPALTTPTKTGIKRYNPSGMSIGKNNANLPPMARPLRGHEARDSSLAMGKQLWLCAFVQEEEVSLLQPSACYSASEIAYPHALFIFGRSFYWNNTFPCLA
jgi:hypothetical protein